MMVHHGIRSLFAACLVLALAVGSAEAQKKDRQRGRTGGSRNIIGVLVAKYQRAGLDENQKKQVATIVKGYGSQIEKIQASMQLTPEQRKARIEAVAKAKADGLTGPALRQAVAAAVELTDAQKEARAKFRKLQQEINRKVVAILTPEQKQKMRQGRRKEGRGKKAGRGKGAKKRQRKKSAE